MAVWGAVKYMPLPLFAIALLQLKVDERKILVYDLPIFGAGMTLATFALQFIPALNSSLMIQGRLSGLFQYPNTFAVFLLAGLVVLLLDKREKKNLVMDFLCGLVLLFGLIQSGSRATFLLAIPVLLITLIISKNKKLIIGAGAAVVAAVAISFFVLGIDGIVGATHILDISLSSSSMLGRVLYLKDAMREIITHPFGKGYMGYYFTQGAFQTGVYSTRWVHNGIVQVMLDAGIIPGLALIVLFVKTLLSKRVEILNKVILCTLAAHAMIDFDMQFVSIFFVMMLCLDWEDGKVKSYKLNMIPAITASVLISLFSCYIGVVSWLTYEYYHPLAMKLYPANTMAKIELLKYTDDAQVLESLADSILAQNDDVSLAWSAKALTAYSRGDFGTYISCKRNAIALSKYSLEEYTDYFEKLKVGVDLYLQAGDTASAKVCYEEIKNIEAMIDEVLAKTDDIGWKISDKPELELPKKYHNYLKKAVKDIEPAIYG